MTLTTKSGDLDAKEDYILQQCNCVACRPHGLSAAIAKKFPFAQPNPGSIQLLEDENCSTKGFVCLLNMVWENLIVIQTKGQQPS